MAFAPEYIAEDIGVRFKDHTEGVSTSTSKSILPTTLLINESNRTIVGTWDLVKVEETETEAETEKVVRLIGNNETLGPDGDRRVRVAKLHFAPGGKYRSVCKLFMGYHNRPGREYVGTGWLIGDDLVVTAGHCLYDWRDDGGFLKYIKVYIGYNGPDSVTDENCQYRRGVVAAAPAEYLKAASFTHDVGFIRLEKAFTRVEPVKYDSTPAKGQMDLGIVGYPGERDFGRYMYEHWQPINVDLAKTGALLNYKIDTTGGQSGSPVFTRALNAIGVHVAGGWPNVASVIGPLGNIFTEYVLAMQVKEGLKTDAASKVKADSTKVSAPGFTMIAVRAPTEPGLPNHAVNGKPTEGPTAHKRQETAEVDSDSNEDDDVDDSTSVEDEDSFKNKSACSDTDGSEGGDLDADAESALVDLMKRAIKDKGLKSWLAKTRHHGHAKRSTPRNESAPATKPKNDSNSPRKNKATGAFLTFPEALMLSEADSGEAKPDLALVDKALAKAKSDPDIDTIFFVNFPPNFQGAALKELQKIQRLIQTWQAWSSSSVEGKVQEKINNKQLPADNDGASMAARGSYRSKVFDYLMRQSTWFAKTYEQSEKRQISCKTVEFHTEILKAALDGFLVPATALIQLEKIIGAISDGVLKVGREKNGTQMQYWIMLTRYQWHEVSQTIQPIIRTISFQSNQQTNEYVVGKNKYSSVSFDLSMGQYQCDFNWRIYRKIAEAQDEELVKKGLELAKNKTWDVPV